MKLLTIGAISTMLFCACAHVAHSGTENSPKGKVYKVETKNGVPLITMDGKVVRGRIFWGSYGGRTSPAIDSKYSETSFEYTADTDCRTANLQLRAGEAAGEFYFSKIEFKNVTTGQVLQNISFADKKRDQKLYYWCAGMNDNPPLEIGNVAPSHDAPEGALRVKVLERNPLVGGLHFYLSGLPIKKGDTYKCTVVAKASPQRNLSLQLYDTSDGNFSFVAGNGKSTFESQVECARDGGINFVSFGISTRWKSSNGVYDFSYVDRIFKSILAVNPKARLWPRVGVDAPQWWTKENPDDTMTNSDGSKNFRYASVSSEKYRKDAYEALRKFIEYCEANYPENMSGYMPTGANTGEWFYGGTWLRPYSGYDKATVAAWRKWLAKKYQNDGGLQKGWNNPKAALASTEIPSESEREGTGSYLIDPSKSANVADFNDFLQDEMVSLIDGFGDVIRKTAPDRLSIFFYAYGFEFAGVRNGPAFSGHYGLKRVLETKYFDIICGPISYHDRKFGDGKTVMGAAESIALAGKIWLDEDDTSTYLDVKIPGRCPATDIYTDTQEKTIKVLRRNLAQEAVRNQASWWMDLFGDGWFDDPALWEQMKVFKQAEFDMIRHPVPYKPDIALVMDEASMCRVAGNATSAATTAWAMQHARFDLNRLASPFGHYLLPDVLEKKTSAKLNVFLSAFAMNAKQRAQMREVAEGSSCIFALAPGLIDLDANKFSLDAVKEATGFEVKYAGDVSARAFATEDGLKIGLPKATEIGKNISPLLSPVPEKGDIVLAKFSNDMPAIVLRPSGGKPKVFVGTSEISRTLYGHMIDSSGARRYSRQEVCVYANGAYISVAAVVDGEVEIDVGKEINVYDAFEKKLLGKGPVIKLDMKKGDVYLLRVGAGNADLKD